MHWKAGGALCKLYSVLDYGTMFTHAFMLVFLLLFLYFWYRKQESYMTEDGTTVVRKTRMHKWALPLAWVIGMGLAIPGGALSEVWSNSKFSRPFFTRLAYWAATQPAITKKFLFMGNMS